MIGFNSTSQYLGQSFYTTGNDSILKSININALRYIPPRSSQSITGSFNVSIWNAAQNVSNLWVPTGTILGSVDYNVSNFGIGSLNNSVNTTSKNIDMSSLNITFNANTHYAFKISLANVNFSSTSAYIKFAYNDTSSYADGNMFTNSSPDGMSTNDLVGNVTVAEIVAVPEPGTLVLFTLALAVGGIVWYLRPRKQKMTWDQTETLQLPA